MKSGRSHAAKEALPGPATHHIETFLHRAHELAKVGIYILDLTSRRVQISPEMAYLLRIGESWIEMPLEEFRSTFLRAEDREAIQAKAEQAYATGSNVVLESRVIRGDGEVVWLRSSSSVERDEHGDPIVVGVVQDITESAVTIQNLQITLADLKQAQADLALDRSLRGALNNCLHALPRDATAEQSGQAICDALWAIAGVDFAAVFEFSGPDKTSVLAHRAPPGFPATPTGPGFRIQQVRKLAMAGAQAMYWRPSPHDGVWGQALTAMDVKAVAFGPIIHGDHLDGAIVLATCDPAFARTIVERLPAVVDLSSTPSAMLAERLHVRREHNDTRAAMLDVIAQRAFWMVFQPLVDLNTYESVGFEALVRFASGQPPEECLANARRVGVGVDLELALLELAVDVARRLPPGRPLHLNTSPAVLADAARLRDILSLANRPVVLEVTEHEMVEDYRALREIVRGLGPNVRVAVDDAGAGVANFAHIVELRPDFVKLDIGLVRGVNADLGRQALVIAMRQFARAAGCHLVAEGVETADEAATLRSLGVEFGQGYLFGRPDKVDAWTLVPEDS